jgi:Tfp pilus assembly PilM family ATPase
MTLLGIDFRDGCLRFLSIKDGSVTHAKVVRNVSVTDRKSAGETLASEIKETGFKRGTSYVILPNDIVRNRIFQIPAMEFGDAKIFVGRELSKELKGQKFVYGIRRLSTDNKTPASGQYILADYALAADISSYLDFMKSCGLRPSFMASGLEGNIHMFRRFRPETDGNEALLDIGIDAVEITVFRNGEPLDYEKIPMTYAGDENIGDLLEGQSDKIKSYRVVDALFKFMLSYSRERAEEKLSALWVCGIGSTLEGLANSITEGLNIPCRLINPFETEIADAGALTSLKGLSALSAEDVFINLIPEDILAARTRAVRRVLLAASLAFYIVLILAGFVFLHRSERDMRLLFEKVKADEALRISKHRSEDIFSFGRETLSKLASDDRSMYGAFRDLANMTPPQVVLTEIHSEKSRTGTILEITAVIQYTDENFRNAVLSKFVDSLDRSASLKRTSPPQISMPRNTASQKEVVVKVICEVIK